MRENGKAKNGLKNNRLLEKWSLLPLTLRKEILLRSVWLPRMRDNKIDSDNKLTATKYQISLSLYIYSPPGSWLKTFQRVLKVNQSIYEFICMSRYIYCKLEKLKMNNLISHYGIYWRFRLGDTFLLKSNRIRMFNTTCKTGKTLWIIHFRFYLSRKFNYLNCSKYGVQWWTDQGGAAGYNLVYRATPRLLPSHYWN